MEKEESLESVLEDYHNYCLANESLEKIYSKGKMTFEEYVSMSNVLDDYHDMKFGPYTHFFDSFEDFEKAFLAIFDKDSLKYAKQNVEHERQHGAVAEKYGIDVQYGFMLFDAKNYKLFRTFCYVAYPEDAPEEFVKKVRKECAEAVDDPSELDLAISDTE